MARLVEAHGDEPWDREAPEAAAVAAAAGIADLLEFFARMAQGVRLPKLAYLLSLARVQAAAEASANVRKPPIPNSSNGGPPPTPDEREVGAPPTRTAHFRAHYENLSRLA